MPPFEERAPAELFLAKRTKSSHDNDRRFATAAEAIRYPAQQSLYHLVFGAWLQVR